VLQGPEIAEGIPKPNIAMLARIKVLLFMEFSLSKRRRVEWKSSSAALRSTPGQVRRSAASSSFEHRWLLHHRWLSPQPDHLWLPAQIQRDAARALGEFCPGGSKLPAHNT
jgi:hypothetical protein